MKKVAVVTGTRADWGLLSPVAKALCGNSSVNVAVIATNMHLDPTYGDTLAEIRADGFTIEATVPMRATGDSGAETAAAMEIGRAHV